MPTKGLVSETLSLISLLPAEAGGDGDIKGTVDVINASSDVLTKRALVRTQHQAGLSGVFGHLSHIRYTRVWSRFTNFNIILFLL